MTPAAPPSFVVAPSVSLGYSPTSVAAGHLTSSGALDIVTADYISGNVTVFVGQGQGSFAPGVSYAAGTHPSSVTIADIDGDGKAEVILANDAEGVISVFPGNGEGKLASRRTYAVGFAPAFIATGDLTGHGRADVAVAGASGRALAILQNDGAGNLGTPLNLALSGIPTALTSADFNQDGHLDLAAATAGGTTSILLGKGNGQFTVLPDIPIATGALSSITVAYLNQDGKDDLIVTCAGQNQVAVLLGRGDGTFNSANSFATGNSPVVAHVADVDGDGIPDLIVINSGDNTFSVLKGRGDGTFNPAMSFVVGNAPLGAVIGDFYGNGHIDLATIDQLSRTLSVPAGNGDGTFLAGRAYVAGVQPVAIASGDLAHRGRSDMVVASYCPTDATCNGAGSVAVLLAKPDGAYQLSSTYAMGTGSAAIYLLDVNHDGNLDLITLNRVDKSVAIRLGVGNGTFGQLITVPLSAAPIALGAADFNNDGNLDLAVLGDCGSANCAQPGEVETLLGSGAGYFHSAATYTVGYSPASVATGVTTNSGNADVVVANRCGQNAACLSGGTATLLFGDGTGALKPATELALGEGPSFVALGDLSGTGTLDLVASLSGENAVAVLPGSGNGSFGTPALYPVGHAPGTLVVADFNGDGQLDVAVANTSDSTIGVLFGSGGKLQPALSLPVSGNPSSLAAIGPTTTTRLRLAGLATVNGNTTSATASPNVTFIANSIFQPMAINPGAVTLAVTPAGALTVNQTVTLSVTVAASGANGTPTGNVQFQYSTNGGSSFFNLADCGGATGLALDGTGSASCTTQQIPAGAVVILQANYLGDGVVYGGSTSNQVTRMVNAASPSVGLTASPASPSPTNTPVTFTAALSGAVTPVNPNGTMTFAVGGTTLAGCTGQVNTSGVKTCTVNNLAVGVNSITATYSGDSNFVAANQGSASYTISKASRPFGLSASGPLRVNSSVTFSATLIGPFIPTTPTGTVAFSDGGTAIGSCTAQSMQPSGANYVATCTVSNLTVGAHSIAADYTGDGNFNGTFVGPLPITITKAATTLTIAAPVPSAVNTNVTFTATLHGTFAPFTPTTGSPTSTVAFFADGSATPIAGCGAAQLQAGTYTATCTMNFLNATAHSISATYSGDNSFASSSTTTSALYTPTKLAGALAIASSVGTSTSVGTTVTFTVSLTGAAFSPIAPSGNISFNINGAPDARCAAVTINSGQQATCTTNALTAGNYVIGASYSGDTNFSAPDAPNISLSVVKATSTTVLQPSPSLSSSVFGQQVNFVAYVSNGGSPVAPTGEVNIFTYDLGLIGRVKLVDSGTPGLSKGTFNYALLKPGYRGLYAVYLGDSNYNLSTSATFNVQVVSRPVALAVVPSPATVGVGAWSTVSVTVTDVATTGPSGGPGFSVAPPATHLQTARSGAAAVLLLDGTILITGGQDYSGNNFAFNTAEIYDPTAMTFTTLGSTMASHRVHHTATLLKDGTVLIAGGSDDGGLPLRTAEIYDPIAGTFTPIAGHLTAYRLRHSATLLPSGKVLITGGDDTQGAVFNSAEIYDPVSRTFASVNGWLAVGRYAHTATLLGDGTHILITGGDTTGTAEVITYDAGSNAIATSGTATWDLRTGHSATLLPDGNVIIIGGYSQSQGAVVNTAELYQVPASFSSFPTTFATVKIAGMIAARRYHTATLMNNGRIGIAGGDNDSGPSITLDSAEAYTPAYDSQGTAAIISNNVTDTLSPSDCTLVIGGSAASTCFIAVMPNHLGSLRTLTATYTSDGYHSGATNSGTLTVVKGTQPAVTVTAPASAMYGQAGLSAVASGGTGTGAYVYDAGTSTACSVDANSGALAITRGSGTCSITATRAGDADYNVSAVSAPATVSVSPAPLTITASSFHKTYGTAYTQAGTEFATTPSTLPNGDQVGSVTLTSAGFAALAEVVAPGPTYSITPSVAVFSFGMASNYTITYANGTVTVDQAPLTVTASSFHKTYGTLYTPVGTEFTTTPNVLPNGDTVGSITLTSAGFAAGATVVAPGPTYTITPSAAVFSSGNASNYTITYANATLTVDKSALTVAANSFHKTYGTIYAPTGTEFTTSPSTLPNGDKVSSITLTSGGFAGAATVISPGPTYAIAPSAAVFSAGDAGNYAITYPNGTLTIDQALLTITANSFHKTYGALYTPTGTEFTKSPGTLPNGDIVGSITLTSAGFAAAATVVAPGPTYTITPSAAVFSSGSVGNYGVTYVNGTLTGDPATASVTPIAASKTYGTTDPSLTGTLNGFLAADGVTAAYNRASGETVAGGPYAISATLSPTDVLGNYAITYNSANLTITQRPLHVTATGVDRAYNATSSATVSLSDDRKTGDALTLTSAASFSDKNVGVNKPVSVTSISVTGGADQGNYTLANTTAATTATITQAPAAVTPNASSKTYGSSDPMLSGTLTGFVASDSIAATYGRAAGETVTGGPYLITATLSPAGALGNYNITYNNANFTITPAPLTITVTDKTRLYGASNPSLDGTVTGVLNSDGIAATYSTTALVSSNIGNYPITATVVDPNSRQSNYTITNTPGTLAITAAPLTIVTHDKSRLYGASNPSLDGTVTGVFNSDGITATYSTTALVSSNVGNYPITATMVDPNSRQSNYTITNTPGTLTITAAPSRTTLESNTTNTLVGTPVTFTATVALVSGTGTPTGTVTFKDGSATLATGTLDATGKATYSTSNMSSGLHSVIAVYVGSLNVTTSTSTSQSVNLQDFSLPATPLTISLLAGQTKTGTFTVTPQSGFTGTVSFTCAVPANMRLASCSASSVQVNGTSGVDSTLTVVTTAPSKVASTGRGKGWPANGFMLAVLFGCLGISVSKRRRIMLLTILVIALLIGGAVGCGNGSSAHIDPGTPAGSYTLTLTAASGTAVHTMNVTATVQ